MHFQLINKNKEQPAKKIVKKFKSQFSSQLKSNPYSKAAPTPKNSSCEVKSVNNLKYKALKLPLIIIVLMINDKISFTNDIIHPSLIIISSPSPENQSFLAKIQALMNYPLNSTHTAESLNIYAAVPHNNRLYHLISLSLTSFLSASLPSAQPFLKNSQNVVCIIVTADYSSYQSYLDSTLPLISYKHCLYITYSNPVFNAELFAKERKMHFISFEDPRELLKLVFGLNNDNNYLSKKRIFTIEKIRKDGQGNNNKSLRHSGDDSSESSENHLNEDHSNSKNSLISISKEVYKFIKNKASIQGNDVTQHIIDLLSKSGQQVKYKNIQRRVYDAINVMSAIGILSKDRGKISFIKEDKPVKLTINSSKENTSSTDELASRITQLTDSIKAKQAQLIAHCSENLFYKKFIQLNQSDHRRSNTLDKLDFPFHIITLNSDSEYSIKEDDFNHRVVILSNKPFQILYPDDLIKFFVQNDFTMNTIQHLFSKEIVQYITDNKLIDNCFSIDKDEMPALFRKRKTRNSFSFGPRLFEPISILDSESNFNLYTGMEMRKGSEDNVFNTFMMMKNDELFEANDKEERNYSNYFSHSYHSKH